MSLDVWWVHTSMSWLLPGTLDAEEVRSLWPWNGSTPKNLVWIFFFFCGKPSWRCWNCAPFYSFFWIGIPLLTFFETSLCHMLWAITRYFSTGSTLSSITKLPLLHFCLQLTLKGQKSLQWKKLPGKLQGLSMEQCSTIKGLLIFPTHINQKRVS